VYGLGAIKRLVLEDAGEVVVVEAEVVGALGGDRRVDLGQPRQSKPGGQRAAAAGEQRQPLDHGVGAKHLEDRLGPA
jgi:hypothetical protein